MATPCCYGYITSSSIENKKLRESSLCLCMPVCVRVCVHQVFVSLYVFDCFCGTCVCVCMFVSVCVHVYLCVFVSICVIHVCVSLSWIPATNQYCFVSEEEVTSVLPYHQKTETDTDIEALCVFISLAPVIANKQINTTISFYRVCRIHEDACQMNSD